MRRNAREEILQQVVERAIVERRRLQWHQDTCMVKPTCWAAPVRSRR
jgi:hypothetical protein